MKDITTLDEAIDLLDQWIDAYRALERAYLRLQYANNMLRRDYEHARSAIENDLAAASAETLVF